MSDNGNTFHLHHLPNGLRVAIERMPQVRSAAAGFLARTGARDETPELAGVSHFLEHMCFKGTPRRNWEQINTAFDQMAVDYNAYTSEERTFYYGWVRTADIGNQIELLADMMRSLIPADEFDMEKKVVLDEIARSNDQNMHVAYDFLHEQLFGGHPLSWPVLGFERTVGALTRDQMHDYFRRRYAPNNLLLLVAGNVDPVEIIAMAEQHCRPWDPAPDPPPRTAPPMRTGRAVRQVERFNQQIVALAYPAPSADDPLNETAGAAATILGGANSRFFWNIVQTGLSPDASCYRVPYCDCGLTLLWGQTDPQRAEELAEAMQTEARRMRTKGVDEHEVQRVKNKRRTGLALEAEAPYHRLVQIMDDVDLRGQPRTVQERLAAVDAISAMGIAEYFEQYPIDGEGFLVSVGPRDWPQ
ncbi:MAG: insulinase family protein [bacterium]|nr:insulinase family protein [bacterium]